MKDMKIENSTFSGWNEMILIHHNLIYENEITKYTWNPQRGPPLNSISITTLVLLRLKEHILLEVEIVLKVLPISQCCKIVNLRHLKMGNIIINFDNFDSQKSTFWWYRSVPDSLFKSLIQCPTLEICKVPYWPKIIQNSTDS